MNFLAQLWRRLIYLARRKQIDADLAEEMRLHMELRAAEKREDGASEVEARQHARKEFGNETRLREKAREAWGWGWLDSLGQDLRYGWRNLMNARAFTITCVLSLALGIGANTAIFSIVNALMLRSLPVPDPHRLVKITVNGNDHLTNPLWESIREHQNAFSGVFAYSSQKFDLSTDGEKRLVPGLIVSGEFFKTLGVPALRGRLFSAEDDLRGGGRNGPVAVISHAFWQSHYGAAPDVIGKSIQLDGHRFDIVGVAPEYFRGVEAERAFSVAIPIACEPMFHPDGSALQNRSWWWLKLGGRLQPGLSAEEAVERLKVVSAGIMKETLPDWDDRGKADYAKQFVQVTPSATGYTETSREQRAMMFAMMGVVAMVLLIACANIANLLMARSAVRQQEISVRLAMGAGRARVVRQFLTESLLLAALGIPAALFLSKWGAAVLLGMISHGRDQIELDTSLDARVLLFTTAITLFTGLLFGLAPALRATQVSPNDVLKQNSRGAGGGSARFRFGRALVAGQIALSLAMLVAAALFITTMRNLLNVSLGFNKQNIIAMSVDTRGRVAKDRRLGYFENVLETLRRTPGVISVGSAMVTPVSGMAWNGRLFREGEPEPQSDSRENMAWFNRVSPGYFDTLQLPVKIGRDFDSRDTTNAPKVMVIGEKTARDLFGNESPIGKRLALQGGPGKPELHEIIGVVPDAKYAQIKEETRRTAYVCMSQDASPWEGRTFLVRTPNSQFNSVIPALKKAMTDVTPVASIEFASLETQINDTLRQQRMITRLFAFFGGLALLLAVVGLYGVTAYAAAQRKGEIGIRMALGAQRSSVIWLVLRDVAFVLAIGVFVGVALSIGAGKLLASLMYGVQPGDPRLLAIAALVLTAASGIAGLLPALRASRVDPAIALRYE